MTVPPAGVGAAAAGVPAVDRLAAELIALYVNAEQRLLDDMTRAAARGVRDGSLAAQQAMLTAMRRAAQRVVNALALRSPDLVRQITDAAASSGDAAALALLRAMVEGHPTLTGQYLGRTGETSGHAAAAALSIRLDLERGLTQTWRGITRWADDAYRAAVAQATIRLVGNSEGLTPATAAAAAWRDLTRQGVNGFTDTAGRNWNLTSYVEMATRTATQRAYNAAAEGRYAALGINYFTVPHDGHPCPICRPWEGAVLSNGRTGTVAEAHSVTGAPVAFTVKATIADARLAGLWHPNCRHTLQPYLPGVTKTTPAKPWSKADQQAYDATQHLRYLERQVRAAKRQQAAALTPTDRARAAREIRRLQAAIREHVDRHGLVRRSRREQVDLGIR